MGSVPFLGSGRRRHRCPLELRRSPLEWRPLHFASLRSSQSDQRCNMRPGHVLRRDRTNSPRDVASSSRCSCAGHFIASPADATRCVPPQRPTRHASWLRDGHPCSERAQAGRATGQTDACLGSGRRSRHGLCKNAQRGHGRHRTSGRSRSTSCRESIPTTSRGVGPTAGTCGQGGPPRDGTHAHLYGSLHRQLPNWSDGGYRTASRIPRRGRPRSGGGPAAPQAGLTRNVHSGNRRASRAAWRAWIHRWFA